MVEDRYITIEKNVRVVIDRNLLRKLSDDREFEERMINLLDARLSSLTHRLSSWLSETIASVILELSSREVSDNENTDTKTSVVLKNENVNKYSERKRRRKGVLVAVFKPSGDRIRMFYVGKRIKQRKFLSYQGRLYRIELDKDGFLKQSSEAYPIIISLVERCGEVPLYWGGRNKRYKVILRVNPDECGDKA